MTGTQSLVDDYLARLEVAASGLPNDRRRELVDDVHGHIRIALDDASADDEAAVRNVLERLGEPTAIVAAEALETGLPEPADATDALTPPAARPARAPLSTEARALLLLTVGAVVLPFVGPLLGLWVAASSTRWSLSQKRTASMIVVVMLALPAWILLPMVAAGELNWIVFNGGFLLPFVPLAGILAATYLLLSSTVVVSVTRRQG